MNATKLDIDNYARERLFSTYLKNALRRIRKSSIVVVFVHAFSSFQDVITLAWTTNKRKRFQLDGNTSILIVH